MFTRFDSFEVTVDAHGEGSRGGKIIGHTTSGKPVYWSAGRNAHKSFSSGEHEEAQKMHEFQAKKQTSRSKKGSITAEALAKHHSAQANRHFERAASRADEGSPGSKIVGHTKSGKAIRLLSRPPDLGSVSDNLHFAGFSKGEHLEASMLHTRLNEKWLNLSNSVGQKYQYEAAAQYKAMAASHDAHREYHSAKSKE